MSRALTLGNSKMLVGFDRFGRVRDLYYPYVGLENHVGGHHVHHIGVWVDGTIKWFGDNSWNISVSCVPEALVGNITAVNETLGVTLTFTDVIYNEENIFVRRITVENNRDEHREIKVYLGHQFEMYESHAAHTAYFDPKAGVLVHYRGKRFFLANGLIEEDKFQDYTTGVFGIEGREGSHRDAEDGHLSRNPIEHGPADSVMGFVGTYEGGESKTIRYWLCVGETLGEVNRYNEYVRVRTIDHLIQTTTDYWHAWVNRQNFTFYGLSEEVIDLFKKSLFMTKAHADETSGAIIASADSGILQAGKDTYAYTWPRDGALTSIALYQSSSYQTAGRFFHFCNNVLTPEGYLMHKYAADGTLGSSWHPWVRDGKPILPIQEDETALVLYTLWHYYELSKDLEFIEDIYNSFIKKSADFLLMFRDDETKLPMPSYDLWEEKYGVHTFTAAAVVGALSAAADFAELLGKSKTAQQYNRGAKEMKEGIVTHLYNEESGMFYKMILPQEEGPPSIDHTVDISSVYGIYRFGVLPVTDQRVTRAMEQIEEALKLDTEIGGVARYVGDNYHRVNSTLPGNPWFVTTLWLAQYYIAIAKREDDMKPVKEWLEWCVRHANDSGVLPEQLHPYTGDHLSVGPLSWSHAEFIITVVAYLNKLEELGVCLACNPVQ